MSLLASEPNLDDSDDEQVDGQQTMSARTAAGIDDGSDSALDEAEDSTTTTRKRRRSCRREAIGKEEEENKRNPPASADYSSEAEEEERARRESLSTKVLDTLEAVTGRQLSPRWRNLFQRGLSGLSLISGFCILVYIGPIGLLFLTFLVVSSSFSEIMTLGYKVCGVGSSKDGGVGSLVHICRALFLCQTYYLYAEDVFGYLSRDGSVRSSGLSSAFSFLVGAHQFVSFSGYLAILVAFVLSLETEYIRSYAVFAWCHLCLFLVGVPGRLMNSSMLEGGLIFYVLPMTLITLNDIAAYFVGFFAGKTPLIKLSPKKTYEGFLGGGALTLIFGTAWSALMAGSDFLVCPPEVSGLEDAAAAIVGFPNAGPVLFRVPEECQRNDVFVGREYEFLGQTFTLMPFLLHGFVISLICSTIGPFGGFFASGFKRACKRKNFGSLIPGHGGVTDRCDCMFLCAAVINVYYNAFIKENSSH